MNAKTLLAMVLGAGLLWTGARLLNSNSSAPPGTGTTEELLLPGLKKRINDVRALKLESADGTLHFQRTEQGQWTLDERANYPSDRKKLDGLVLALARSKRLEQKTSKPERYAALGLASGEDGKGAPPKLQVMDAEGAVLASLEVGERRDRSATEAYFVRLNQDPVCWVASGRLELDPSMVNWLDSTLVDLASDQIQSVRITHPDGETLLLSRPEGGDKNSPLEILNLPEGQELQSEWVTSRFASALQGLKLQDVKAASEVSAPEGEIVRSEFWTPSNLHLTVESWLVDSLLYVRLHADHSTEGRRLTYQGPQKDGVPAIDLADGAHNGDGSTTATQEDVTAQAAEWNARFQDWVYVLPAWKGSALRARMQELLKTQGDTEDPFANAGPGIGTPATEPIMHAEEQTQPESATEQAPGATPTPQPEPSAQPASEPEAKRPVFEIDSKAVKSEDSVESDPVAEPE